MGYRKVNKRGERLIDKRHTFKGNMRRAGFFQRQKRKKKDECFISVCFGEQAPETENLGVGEIIFS